MSSNSSIARGTQSFVHVLALCWKRKSLLAIEVLWRWLAGTPLLLLLSYELFRLWRQIEAPLAATGILDQFSLAEPMKGAVLVANAFGILWPPALHLLLWFAPLALAVSSFASGFGRNVVLRRYDPVLAWRPVTLVALQLLRIGMFVGSYLLWFVAVRWAGANSLRGVEPDLVSYSIWVICLSLGIFTLWALLSWVFSIAPLIAIVEGRGIASSLLRSLRLGSLKGKLVEVNLVMGIVKLALIVLAMVFSATPLPFESVVNGWPLYAWWILVTLLYCVASDYFQVARTIAFVEFLRAGVESDPALHASSSLKNS
ncbi:hypothetical protein [Acidipila rosea]|uniref:hypothetical protein n=1 Tax=Acidipila rosea TaxID=768535 RepID=UPI001FB35942|nr:hypothetical protein [Acidipila rosea]